jgi:hypothetical protein
MNNALTLGADGKLFVAFGASPGIEPPNNEVDITNVVNNTWFHMGQLTGGITWSDPGGIAFDYIEITDILTGTVAAQVEPGARRWTPEAGTHQYRLRVKITGGGFTTGVTLEETTYVYDFTAALIAATVPYSMTNSITLEFDNYVTITNAEGFSVSGGGLDDSLVLLDQPDGKSIRLYLATQRFEQGINNYKLHYNAAEGNVRQADNTGLLGFMNFGIDNHSAYEPAKFVSAMVPQAEPTTFVLVMSRPIRVIDKTKFTFPGSSVKVKTVVSEGVTVEFLLDEPVDADEEITVSLAAGGAVDEMTNAVAAFSKKPVVNNSAHVEITMQLAEIPASDPRKLIVVMQGAITMDGADGFMLTSPEQANLPKLWNMPYTLSDGTITFTLPENLRTGVVFNLAYTPGSVRAKSNGDRVKAFLKPVVNNSTDLCGIGPGVNRNLGILLLGHDPINAQEMRTVFEKIHLTIAAGFVSNFNGDFIYPALSAQYKFTVAAGYDTGGGIDLSANTDLGANGKLVGFRVVSRNGLKGKNFNDYDHAIIQMMNLPTTHYMEASNINSNGYMGCKGRQYLLNSYLPALKNLGIPFDEDWMKGLVRKTAKAGNSAAAGVDQIQDKLFLPTEAEMFGTNANSTAEALVDQGRLEYYDNNAKRIKYNSANTATNYWEGSPHSGSATYFCNVITSGASYTNSSNTANGFAPAFCVG